MNKEKVFRLSDDFIMPTYGRKKLLFDYGEGSYLFDKEKNKYLDFLSGISVTNLGHSHPRLSKALKKQAKKLWHTSNLYYIENQAKLAREISEHGLGGKSFFANSGAEANEAAIKLARYYGNSLQPGKNKIVSLNNSFHGRSLATIAMTGQPQYQKGFEPLPPGFSYIDAEDVEALERSVSDETAAVFLEVVQGESGVHPLSADYVAKVREVCTRHKALMIVDEVQTGMGRTGKWFGFEHYKVKPDAVTLAKALANGLPIGALHTAPAYSDVLGAKSHASTFGGGPLVTRVALEVLDVLSEGLLAEVATKGEQLRGELERLRQKYSFITEIRGKGLMIGMGLAIDAQEVYAKLLEKRLLVGGIGNHTLRLLPPFVMGTKEIDRAVKRLDKVFSAF